MIKDLPTPDNRTDGRIKNILSVLYIVLNIDRLQMEFLVNSATDDSAADSPPSVPWEGEGTFYSDWAKGIAASLLLLQHLRNNKLADSQFICNWEKGMVKYAGTCSDGKQRVELRCFCESDCHKDIWAATSDRKLFAPLWPPEVLNAYAPLRELTQ
jgi:hypothetical protein